jgi:hypothetical protein
LRTILLNEFWPKVRTLALSTLEEPGNPLSASLIISNHYEGTETLEITQGHVILFIRKNIYTLYNCNMAEWMGLGKWEEAHGANFYFAI